MSETETAATDQTTADPAADATDATASTAGEQALGDPGKKALDAMKAERNAAREQARKAAEDLAAMKAAADGKEAEHAAEIKAREVESAALAKANERILKAEIRAAAAGKLADPADALQFLDLSALEVGADGEVDGQAVAVAIEDLVKRKPYLAAQGGKRFEGSADAGARKESAKSIEDQIAQATAAGNHALAIALKQQRAATKT